MEVYNPYSIVQVSEVLGDLVVRSSDKPVYRGRGVVMSMVNTGLMALVSVALVGDWSDLNVVRGDPQHAGQEAQRFIDDWDERFNIRRDYQVVISEARAFLAETSRWADQADISESLPRDNDGRLRDDVFYEIAAPILKKSRAFFDRIEDEAPSIPTDHVVTHRAFAQSALHPLLLRAPFVYRTFAKPLGYAGDYEMVNQILGDPRQGHNSYFQMVNTLFLKAGVAEAHRNRIEILYDYLEKLAEQAIKEKRPLRVLNVGCGPAVEIQRFIATHHDPSLLAFTLVDFSEETLNYTRGKLDEAAKVGGKSSSISFVHESVHDLLKRVTRRSNIEQENYDYIYCAGLFDYLSDKVCARLIEYFVQRLNTGGRILVTNVHTSNPERNSMEHLLEWHLIYRNDQQLESVLPKNRHSLKMFADKTGVNVFAEFQVNSSPESRNSL